MNANCFICGVLLDSARFTLVPVNPLMGLAIFLCEEDQAYRDKRIAQEQRKADALHVVTGPVNDHNLRGV